MKKSMDITTQRFLDISYKNKIIFMNVVILSYSNVSLGRKQ
jgi:hypothetical protein